MRRLQYHRSKSHSPFCNPGWWWDPLLTCSHKSRDLRCSYRGCAGNLQEGTGKGEARDKEVQGNGLDDSSEDDGLPPLEPNNNRRVVYYSESDSGSNSDG